MIHEWMLHRRWEQSSRITWKSIWKAPKRSIGRRGRWEYQETTLVSSRLLLPTNYYWEIFVHNSEIRSCSICKSFFPPRINFILFGSNIYLLDSSDDSEDSVCIPCTGVGNLWCLWKWGIQVVLRVCVHCKYVQLSITHCYVWFIKWDYRYPYITIVLNFSQMWALFCLVKFYNVTHERLQPIRPLAKFISFKAIVFATWWQGVGIALLCSFGVLPNQEKLQTGLQDFLICIEVCCFLT